MRAYYFDNLPGDQRLPHATDEVIDVAKLGDIGVLYWNIPLSGDYEREIDAIALKQGYKNRDTISITREGLGDLYDSKIKTFFEEHMHEDEEIRYVLEGSGYFDVRDRNDKWIRCAVDAGDLLVLPAGIYHRFTLDEKNTIRALRLFKDEPKWVPHNRSEATDANTFRKEYVRGIPVQ